MGAGRRARALCRRAGGAGRRREPLHRRGRRRAGDDRIRAAGSGHRSARRVRKDAPLIHPQAETNEVSVRKFSYGDTEGGLRARRSPHRHDDGIPPAVVHADRMLRRGRRAQSGRRQLRRAGEFPGPVFHASGDGARAARRRAEIAPAHPARFRRQLWHKALGVSLCGADRARGENHRPAGEMGRGPHRASGRRKLRPEPRHRRSRPRSPTTAAFSG